jgi:glycosyltransferase involved in cell wall biosynthesis
MMQQHDRTENLLNRPEKGRSGVMLSVIIPTYNEARNIAAAIASVRFADEIIVVDSYSTDETVALAQAAGARVVQRVYDNPAAQKNWAIPQAKHNWVLLLDADERVTLELATEILEKMQNSHDFAGFWIYRTNHFMGKQVQYSGWQHDKVIRLIQRDHCRYPDVLVHEEIVTNGKIGFLNARLLHFTYHSLDDFLQKMNRYAEWQATTYDKKTGRITPFHLVIKPLFRFFKHYILQFGFLDGMVGFAVAVLMAYGVLMRYLRLWIRRSDLQK